MKKLAPPEDIGKDLIHNTNAADKADEGKLSLRCLRAITMLTLTAVIPAPSDGKKPQVNFSFIVFLLLKLLKREINLW